MKKLRLLLVCGAICGLTLVFAGCQEEIQSAEPPRAVRTVIATPVEIGDEISQTGEIQAHIETILGFRVAGRVATRDVEVGMNVVRGQVLATLDSSDIRSEVLMMEAEVNSATAADKLARSELNRQRTLFDKQFVARARVEEAEANWRAADAKLNATKTALHTAQNKMTYTELRAPDDAIVSAVSANAWQVVDAGQPIITLVSMHERDAVFNVSERIYTSAPPDARVEVTLASNPAIKVVGHVRDASPSPDPVTRTYRVRIALSNPPESMTLGATVKGRLILPGKTLIVLPASSLTNEGDKPAVFVVQPSTQELKRKTVTVARYTATQVLVESGIAEGDAVVTAGVSKLRPGQKVAYQAQQVGE